MEKEIVTLKECMLELKNYPFIDFHDLYSDELIINQSKRSFIL